MDTEIPLRVAFHGDVMCLSMETEIKFDDLSDDIRELCKFQNDEVFTMKWIDEEGDACTLSNQIELDEAIRLFFANDESELVINIFKGAPEKPGMLLPGEDRLYRRGARRWRKIYQFSGHSFVARRFGKMTPCPICKDFIWGLGRQGVKCMNCKYMVHKRCVRVVKLICGQQIPNLTLPPSNNNMDTTGIVNEIVSLNGSVRSGRSPTTKRKGLMKTDYEDRDIEPSNGFRVSLNDFEFIRVIGRGSYAKVMMVRLKKTDRIYAMKVIKKELVNDDEDIDWVQTEKHVFEIASNHPFLVGLHSCFQSKSRLFFVIEFVNGGDLMFHMQRMRRLEESHARFYAAEICCALNYLHERGIIYRDLKLDNVLLDPDGHIKLTDYGMCKEGLHPGEKTSTFCGTPNYIAPEILRGEDYGASVDWWALGVLLYEMLAGRSPFDIVTATDNPDQNTEDYLFQVILEKPIRIPRSLSVKAASCLKGFLNKNPEDRLGCHLQTGFSDIQSHIFFKPMDWEALERRQIAPPFKPKVDAEHDILSNFDPQFTTEPVHLTPDDPSLLDKIDQSEFDGFEYVNPLLMSSEDVV
ncbi:protein kinase C iota type isoform X1 [Hydra vulgaris]|uniref:protein kinase C iota type isoform X1 n=1 Tax=Hydra vulgaris TaxID=6087 RepID=UPI000640E585|nr:protein kinase C iota type [Hydra vulgaris]